MKKRLILLMLAGLLACGGNFPPEACYPIEDQEVYVGNRKAVSICFSDPDGQALTVQAKSSDESVVTAIGREGALTLEGIGIGEAVVTVTATDPDGQMVEELVDVTVPNRPPEVVSVPRVRLSEDDTPSLDLDLSVYFTDPDGQALMYDAVSLTPEIVAVSVAGDIATFTLTGVGVGGVGVTATDEGGLSAMSRIPVTTSGVIQVFRDEFDELSNLWEPDEDTDVLLDSGRLRINVNKVGHIGYMPRNVRTLDGWKISMNIENATVDMWGGLVIETTDPVLDWVAFIFGADSKVGFVPGATAATNFGVVVRDTRDGGFHISADWSGFFDEIEGPGVATDLVITAANNEYVISINGTEIMRVQGAGPYPQLPMGLRRLALISWPALSQPINAAGGSFIDWIELSGTPLSPFVADSEDKEPLPMTTDIRRIIK